MAQINPKFVRIAAVVAVVSIILLALPASAENLEKPALRQGYYLTAGPFFNMSVNNSTDGNTGPWPGPGINFRFGESINRWLDLGIGSFTSWGFQDNYELVLGSFSLEASIKPTKSFFIVLGAGAGWADITRTEKGMNEIIGRFSATYTIMAAWDIFVGKQRRDPYKSGGVSMTPFAGVQLSPASVTSTYSFMVGFNVTWWSGLRKNQLDLPIDKAY